ncbi:acyl-CoA thioesterase [Numidum massiliense]|uniref:acyl-CoA thioesterase n=1 Tax=Numidum massiliense TaxID=1522315 RepID=UPI0006D58EE8|nr:acyl-CoA thioesterase [Numidum massiliense]
MENELSLIVRSTDLDQLGHVNNAKYVEYLEWGRLDWYEQCGLSWDEYLERQVGTVVVRLAVNYRREARKGDRLTVVTRPLTRGKTSFVLQQNIYNPAGDVVVEAEVTSVCFDLAKRVSLPILPELAIHFAEVGA